MREANKICESNNKKVLIYVDSKESDTILPFIFNENLDVFQRFIALVYENRRNTELYKKINISTKCTNLYEIRFMSKSNQNDRIYCLEFHEVKRKIVLVRLKDKRTQDINKKIKQAIEPICSNKYKI